MKVSDKAVQSLRVLIEQSNMQVGDRLPAEENCVNSFKSLALL